MPQTENVMELVNRLISEADPANLVEEAREVRGDRCSHSKEAGKLSEYGYRIWVARLLHIEDRNQCATAFNEKYAGSTPPREELAKFVLMDGITRVLDALILLQVKIEYPETLSSDTVNIDGDGMVVHADHSDVRNRHEEQLQSLFATIMSGAVAGMDIDEDDAPAPDTKPFLN